jgi:hypothetical protein
VTALCGGGTSGPQGGVAGILTLGGTAIEIFLSGLGFPEIAPIVAPIIAALVDLDIVSYCSTDPPSDPGLSAGDIADAISIPPSLTTFDSQHKILTWFEARYWFQICQCNSTSTPAPPTLSNPGGATSNPGLPVQATPCWTVSVPYSVGARLGSAASNWQDLTPLAVPAGVYNTQALQTGSFPVNGVNTAVTPGATQLELNTTLNEAIVTNATFVHIHWYFYTALVGGGGGTLLDSAFFFSGTSTTPDSTRATLPSNAKAWTVAVENLDTVAHTGTVDVSFFCPPGTTTPSKCCPPDPLLEALLQQILQYEQAIYEALPVPLNSFAEGTVHSGLTGNGSITFGGLPVAIKVTLTTIPPAVGFEVGSPDFYFDVGFLTFATSEGSYSQQRIELQDQLLTVPVLAGSVGYTLKNGVVATITELTPGP